MNMRLAPATAPSLVGLLGLGLLLFSNLGYAAPGVVQARVRMVTPRLVAYAEVVSLAKNTVRAAETGRIKGLHLLPGQAVGSGAVLAHLRGPEVAARLARRRAAVSRAQAALRAARRGLAAERQKRAAHLSTRQAVYRAEAAQARAEAQLVSARAALREAKAEGMLRAPAAGTVLALAATDGQRVVPGQRVLTLLPHNRLWLRALYYGAASLSVHRGMRGRFAPANGSASIPVEVVGVLPVAQADGGVAVNLRPVGHGVHWVSGEAGTVTLTGPKRHVVAVPTRALILDRGRWWVLVHTPHGDKRQVVTPGPSRGEETVIEQGLPAGTSVVVDNAYLRFHHDISHNYEPPD